MGEIPAPEPAALDEADRSAHPVRPAEQDEIEGLDVGFLNGLHHRLPCGDRPGFYSQPTMGPACEATLWRFVSGGALVLGPAAGGFVLGGHEECRSIGGPGLRRVDDDRNRVRPVVSGRVRDLYWDEVGAVEDRTKNGASRLGEALRPRSPRRRRPRRGSGAAPRCEDHRSEVAASPRCHGSHPRSPARRRCTNSWRPCHRGG